MVPIRFGLGPMLLLGLITAPVGLILLRRGFWPKRQGTEPRCPKCEYNLTGLTRDRCPECGLGFNTGSIVYGTRRRRPGLIMVGLILFVPLALVPIGLIQQIDWYRFKPTGWVLDDLGSANATLGRRAWRTLDMRYRSDRMSAEEVARLIEICLAEQAKTPIRSIRSDLIEFLGRAQVDGKMTPQQETTFFNQIIRLELEVRANVVRGDKVPVRVSRKVVGPPAFYIRSMGEREIVLDGKACGQTLHWSCGSSGLGAGGSRGTYLQYETPGKHTIELSVPVSVYYDSDETEANLRHQVEVPLEAEFEVLRTEPTGSVKLIRDPKLSKEMQAAIALTAISPPDHPRSRHRVEFAIMEPPANTAFDIIVHIDGEDRKAGTIHLSAGKRTNYSTSLRSDLPDEPFDLILRSSPDVACMTIDMYEIWDGELVFENVSVPHTVDDPPIEARLVQQATTALP